MTRSLTSEGRLRAVDESIQVELVDVDTMRKHGGHLFLAHVEEVEPGSAADLNPNWQSYRAAEALGTLFGVAAWVGPAEARMLVGYMAATVFPSPHYAHLKVCQVDLIFVDKPWRKRGVGWKLINRVRTEARSRGATRLTMHAKEGSAFAKLLDKVGYAPLETVYAEDL